MTKKTAQYIMPFYIVLVGLLLYYGINYLKYKLPQNQPQAKVVQEFDEKEQYLKGKPVRITMPTADIDLKVVDGNYIETTKSWNLSRSNAHFATVTPLANNKSGNTLIYGHNTNAVFGRTRDLKKGDIVQLKTDNGLVFSYKMTGFTEVDPLNTEIFNYQGDPILTVVTCSGIADLKRKLITFEFLGVE